MHLNNPPSLEEANSRSPGFHTGLRLYNKMGKNLARAAGHYVTDIKLSAFHHRDGVFTFNFSDLSTNVTYAAATEEDIFDEQYFGDIIEILATIAEKYFHIDDKLHFTGRECPWRINRRGRRQKQ